MAGDDIRALEVIPIRGPSNVILETVNRRAGEPALRFWLPGNNSLIRTLAARSL